MSLRSIDETLKNKQVNHIFRLHLNYFLELKVDNIQQLSKWNEGRKVGREEGRMVEKGRDRQMEQKGRGLRGERGETADGTVGGSRDDKSITHFILCYLPFIQYITSTN